MACAVSTAYCGKGSVVALADEVAPPEEREASAGQTQREASHSRLSLQSRSLAQGCGSMWAQPSSRVQVAAKREKRRAWRKTAGDGRDVRMAQG
jgi:hypothetical protein